MQELVLAAGGDLKTGPTLIGDKSAGGSSLVLFHAAASVCSQKVRAVLAHHQIAYVSYPIDLFAGENYRPDYIRLRMIGCDAFGGSLANLHTGSTAASSGGCDGVVVPTLVDLSVGRVVVDSRLICLRLDNTVAPDRHLRPAALAGAIDAELAIVDELPNYQLLMGRRTAPDSAAKTAPSETSMAEFSRRKVDWCDDLIARFPGDPVIIAACTAKRSKELSAAKVLFAPAAMAKAQQSVAAALTELDSRLASHSPQFGWTDPTLADLIWAVELLRIESVGLSGFWSKGKLPNVERFITAARDLPAIRSAVTEWPGAF